MGKKLEMQLKKKRGKKGGLDHPLIVTRFADDHNLEITPQLEFGPCVLGHPVDPSPYFFSITMLLLPYDRLQQIIRFFVRCY